MGGFVIIHGMKATEKHIYIYNMFYKKIVYTYTYYICVYIYIYVLGFLGAWKLQAYQICTSTTVK